MTKEYNGIERRKFTRFEYVTPLAYKVCKVETISMLLNGYTADLSQSGVLCNINDKVAEGDILWLSFDRTTLVICEELEKKALIYQNGIIGKVARVQHKGQDNYLIGVQFLTREEKNLTHIYPKFHFIIEKGSAGQDEKG